MFKILDPKSWIIFREKKKLPLILYSKQLIVKMPCTCSALAMQQLLYTFFKEFKNTKLVDFHTNLTLKLRKKNEAINTVLPGAKAVMVDAPANHV